MWARVKGAHRERAAAPVPARRDVPARHDARDARPEEPQGLVPRCSPGSTRSAARCGRSAFCTLQEVAQAMINAATDGSPKRVLEVQGHRRARALAARADVAERASSSGRMLSVARIGPTNNDSEDHDRCRLAHRPARRPRPDGRLGLRQDHRRRRSSPSACTGPSRKATRCIRRPTSTRCTPAIRWTTPTARPGSRRWPTGSTRGSTPASTASSPARRSSAPTATLIDRRGSGVEFVYLHGSRELIASRLAARHGHFMPPSLLDSQFADARGARRRRAGDPRRDRRGARGHRGRHRRALGLPA